MTKDSSVFYKTVRNYLTVFLPKQKGVSDNTIISYRHCLNQFLTYLAHEKHLAFEKISFSDWNQQNISAYLDYISDVSKVSVSTRNQRLFSLRAFLKYARMIYPEIISVSLEIQSISTIREQKIPVGFLSENAMKTLFLQPNTHKKKGIRDLCFMVTMYDCAARNGEMLSLKVDSLNLEGKTPTIRLEGKGNKVRLVPLMDKTVEQLRRYMDVFHPLETRNKQEYLFYTVIHGKRLKMSDDNVARFLNQYACKAREQCIDIPERITPHLFRHSRAMHLYRNGMPLQLLSEYMGHSSLQSTLIYAYADTEMKRKAIEKISKNKILPEAPASNTPIWKTDENVIRQLYGLI